MSVLEKLKDDNEYYRGIGKKYLSNSDIGALLTNPVNFGVSQPDNPNFAKGRLFHQLLLEPHKAKDVVSVESNTRTTKVYKEFIESNKIPFCLLSCAFCLYSLSHILKLRTFTKAPSLLCLTPCSKAKVTSSIVKRL